jgi:hypothetical protein
MPMMYIPCSTQGSSYYPMVPYMYHPHPQPPSQPPTHHHQAGETISEKPEEQEETEGNEGEAKYGIFDIYDEEGTGGLTSP